jgi:lipid A ethanolaminephosphotransferase
VPCMFSHLPRKRFDVDEAPRFANLLDALQEAGLDVEWRDNDAGCKGVCARVHTISYHPGADENLCSESYCYDEILLKDLGEKLETLTNDTVIVMHQIGSHGPAYAERYPREFEMFKPACHSNQLQHCTAQEVVNAYDNSIAYTDHVVAKTIETLRRASGRVDAMLMYASDHGESLGEHGLYLHGLPYAFAPETQTHVPMLMWLSSSYAAQGEVDMNCLEARADQPLSHDDMYHTILGAAAVHNTSYDSQLDILAACRDRGSPRDHE